MKRLFKYLFLLLGIFILWAVFYTSSAKPLGTMYRSANFSRLAPLDSNDLPYPIKEIPDDAYADPGEQSPLYLNNPSNIESNVEYDPETRTYVFTQKVGSFDYRPSSSMTFQEYQDYEMERSVKDYWRTKAQGKTVTGAEGFMPSLNVRGETFDKIFGSNTISIKPQGFAELTFGYNYSKTENPTIPERLRKQSSFDFDEQIRVDVTGTIGDKLKIGINYNTKATFEFENKTKLEYTGDEDEIIQKIEGGNISFPLHGTLISGCQNLFGVKTDLKFGKLTVSALFSQQKSESKTITVQGGAQTSEYKISAGDYDDNRHFLLGHYFYKDYDTAVSNLQIIRSEAKIKNIEVWVTNTRNDVEDRRNILAFVDLGESWADDLQNPNQVYIPAPNDTIPPANKYNSLYQDFIIKYKDLDSSMTTELRNDLNRFESGIDYVYLENARKLDTREYTVNYDLGYISLTQALKSDEILAVAYEYEVPGGAELAKVGIMSKDKPSSNSILMVKLLKGTKLVPELANWDLMMKNIYSIGAFQVNRDDFRMDINYQDDKSGTAVPYIPYGSNFVPKNQDILLSVLGLDQLNSQQDPYPDGVFDFIEGITFISQNGKIIFPSVRPFGQKLKNYLVRRGLTEEQASNYTYDELYTSTKTAALQLAEKNKFYLEGEYKSAFGSEIQLNAMNIPRGSVKIIAGGRELAEGSDYSVDYALGRVKILNDAIIQSGTPLQISLESQELFNVQTKTLWGTHLNYQFNDNFYVGGTFLSLTERPLTKKVNFGDEPISNIMWGLNTSYASKSPFITKMVNAIPLIETNKESNIRIDAEFAQLVPGSPKSVGKNGVAYLDDFEGSESSYSLNEPYRWKLASTPAHFAEGQIMDSLAYGFNRALLAWYRIDNTFYNGNTDDRASKTAQSSNYTREILQEEIFPNIDAPTGIPPRIYTLDLAFYPTHRGPYNFDVNGIPGISEGINPDGSLINPDARWGGIMREVPFKDFEESNVEFIEFWLLDPYLEDSNRTDTDPAIYFDLGDISEDILRDDKKSFENGLPRPDDTTNVLETNWGRVSSLTQITTSFDNSTDYSYQDVGFDGLSNENERSFYQTRYLDQLAGVMDITSPEYQAIEMDPSNDDFRYYRDSYYDDQDYGINEILERYKYYTNSDGNSPPAGEETQQYSNQPDREDIDDDYTMSTVESYYEYKVSMRPGDINEVGRNYVKDIVTIERVPLANGQTTSARWIQFRVPVKEFSGTYGRISGFSSIRFVRMYLKGFSDTVIMRFARLELVRNEWRRYDSPLYEQGGGTNGQVSNALFEMESINIEENAERKPVNYVLPPGFDREIDPSNPQLQQLNEQSMVLRVTDLGDGDARAVYKNMDIDMRRYTRMQMEVHEEGLTQNGLQEGDLCLFVRIGSDYTGNYYEYEVPLVTTPWLESSYYTDANAYQVWPEENQVNIDFEDFINAKMSRDAEINSGNPYVSPMAIYSYAVEGRTVYVKGYPNLANVKTFMIGIRNSSKGNYLKPIDDGDVKSGEIWVNELRLTDFKDKSGWAVNARMQADLADFGSVALAGLHSTPGFGSIEESVSNRALDEVTQYDVSTNLELGKFFPEKSGVSIPAYVEYSNTTITPEYDPLDPDVKLKDKLEIIEDEKLRQEYKEKTVEQTQRQMINFTNVKINKSTSGNTNKKAAPWDISNFSVNYNYNAEKFSDAKTQYDNEYNYRASLFYNFNTRPKNISPFSKTKSKAIKSNYLKPVKDFNFYFLPSRFSFRTDLNRIYQETKLRNVNLNANLPAFEMPLNIYKDYAWHRQYDLKFDITKSLKFDFSATGISRFDETNTSMDKMGVLGFGNVDWNDDMYDNNEYLEKNWYGRITGYNHKFSVTYQVPINKIFFLDWTDLNVGYSATYDWFAGPIMANATMGNLGNNVKNSNNITFNGQLRLTTLYNKLGYLKRLNQKYATSKTSSNKKKEYKTITFEQKEINFYASVPKSIIHKLKSEDISVKVYDAAGNEVPVTFDVITENKIRVSSDSLIKDARIVVEGKIEKKPNPLVYTTDQFVRILTGFKSVSGTYTNTGGTLLTGYTQGSGILGLSDDGHGHLAPGVPFIMGWQDPDFAEKVAGGDNYLWLTEVQDQVNYYTMANTTTWNFRAAYEPFKGFKIDLTSNWTKSEIKSSNYQFAGGGYNFSAPLTTGNYSMTTITLFTSLEKIKGEDLYKSAAYTQFLNNREIIARRLADERAKQDPNYDPAEVITNQVFNDGTFTDTIQYISETGYPNGYSSTSQEVLLHSFYAAYTGTDANKVPLNVFQKIPLPNWRISFTGLSNVKFFKRFAKTINLDHAYRSIYSIGSYSTNITNLDLDGDGDLDPMRDLKGNFLNEVDALNVSITEQFSPLIGVDITWKNDITTTFEMKSQRTISLGFTNTQITDMHTTEYVVGVGYRIKDFKLGLSGANGTKNYQSDLVLRADLTIGDNITVVRQFATVSLTGATQPSQGQNSYSIKVSADYQLSDSFTIRVYYDRDYNKPIATGAYARTTSNFGFNLRFTLIQ